MAPSAAKTKMAVARSSAAARRSVAGSVAVAMWPTVNRRRTDLIIFMAS